MSCLLNAGWRVERILLMQELYRNPSELQFYRRIKTHPCPPLLQIEGEEKAVEGMS